MVTVQTICFVFASVPTAVANRVFVFGRVMNSDEWIQIVESRQQNTCQYNENTVILFTLLQPEGRIAEHSCANAKLVTNEHSSKTVQRYNMHTIQKKLKHKNINRPKITAGLSIELSVNTRGLVLMETVAYKRLVLLCMWGWARIGSGTVWYGNCQPCL